jgi:hypothetical protein
MSGREALVVGAGARLVEPVGRGIELVPCLVDSEGVTSLHVGRRGRWGDAGERRRGVGWYASPLSSAAALSPSPSHSLSLALYLSILLTRCR